MRITVLSDNIGCGDMKGEWGLSIHIDYAGRNFLLDTGASGLFLKNALKTGIDISDVDSVILSHAHYDHTQGIQAFFDVNAKAQVYLSPYARENCYGGTRLFHKYIGLPKGVLQRYGERFLRPDGVSNISDGVWIVPHSTPGLGILGRRNHLYQRNGFRFLPDDFSHEQTLVFEIGDGLVLMNSCSHSGPGVIVKEVQKVFPEKRITAYFGGLHLFRMTGTEVDSVADELVECGIGRIYTGHCTGQKAYDILRNRLGDRIEMIYCGMTVDLEGLTYLKTGVSV